MRIEDRASTSTVGVLLLTALAIVAAATVGVTAFAVSDQLAGPVEPVTLQTEQTDLGLSVTVTGTQGDTPVLVLRNNREIGRLPAEAGTTRSFAAIQGDEFKFVTVDAEGRRGSLLSTVDVRRATALSGRLSLDRLPLDTDTVRVGGASTPVTVTGDTRKTDGQFGDAVQLLYRENQTESGITIEDVPEYESYTLGFMIRSEGDDDDSNSAADENHFSTPLIGWEDGHTVRAYGGVNDALITLTTDDGYQPFASLQTFDSRQGGETWNYVSVTARPNDSARACVFTPETGESCTSVRFRGDNGGVSAFFIGDSRFSGELDEVQLFDEPLTADQRDTLYDRYYDR